MPRATLVRFRAEAAQYGDFKSSVRAILGEEMPPRDTPIEVQLVMYLRELTLYPRSDKGEAQGFMREVNVDEPRYLWEGGFSKLKPTKPSGSPYRGKR